MVFESALSLQSEPLRVCNQVAAIDSRRPPVHR